MQEHLKNAKVKPAAKTGDAGSVQVKSVSSTGNIKISLKPAPEGQKQAEKTAVAPASAKQPKVAKSQTAKAKPVKAANAKISKPSEGMTPKSLASASAQSDAAFALDETAGRSASLKPLGLAAAALGVLALGLGVLQFAGGKSEAVAQGDTGAAQPAAEPRAVEVAPEPVDVVVQAKPAVAPQVAPVITNVEPVSAPVEVKATPAQPVPAPETAPGPKTVSANLVVPSVEPDKAAVVAPVQTRVAPTVVAEATVADPMASVISQAIAKLGSAPTPADPAPTADTVVKDTAAATELKAASLLQANPAPVETAAEEQSGEVAKAPAKAPKSEAATDKYVPAFPSNTATGLNPDLMARLTTGTLDALRSGASQTSTPVTQAAVSDLYRLISQGTAAGKTEAQIAADLVQAHASGDLNVPAGFILPDGQVDTQTILSLFIAH